MPHLKPGDEVLCRVRLDPRRTETTQIPGEVVRVYGPYVLVALRTTIGRVERSFPRKAVKHAAVAR